MRLLNLGACMLALVVVACGGGTVTVDQQGAGTLQLPLTSTSGGKTYRLVGAAFNITGPQTVTVTDTGTDTVQTTLQAGGYTIELASGWRMERADAPGVAVPATLLSPNPLTFNVKKDETSQVRFMFKLPGDGTADVGIHVDSGGWFAGNIRVDSLEGGSDPTNPYFGLMGKSVPFLISFESFTTTRDTWDKITHVTTGPITVQFGGVPSEQLDRVAAALHGSMLTFRLRRFSSGSTDFNGGVVENLALGVRLEMSFGSDPFVGLMDAEGCPVFRPFAAETHLRLWDGSIGFSGMTDVNAAP